MRWWIMALLLVVSASGWGQDSSLGALARMQEFRAERASSSHEDLTKNADARPIEPGETLVLAEIEGPGVITHFWNTVASEDPFYGRSLVLRCYWDGNEKPSVEVPLGDFFGMGHGAMQSYTSLPAAISSFGRSRTCYWRMPFATGARVTVTNESTEHRTGSFYYYLDWQKRDALPEDSAYFHAVYRQEFPAQPGNYTILETTGKGHYVGTVYSAHQVELGWFGEGDDFFYIDGEEYPSLRGTGTEDYFNDAWGFRAFHTPYYGVSLWEGYFPGDRVTAYRWHVEDPIPFEKSLKLEIEHRGSIFTDAAEHLGQFFERPDWVSSVAFWYQDAPVAVEAVLPPVAQRVAPYRIIPVSELDITADPPASITKSAAGILYVPGRPDATIEMRFDVPEDGRYQINAFMIYGLMSGVYQPYLNDKKLPMLLDFAESGQDPVWTSLDLHDLSAGRHTLKFVGQGPSPQMRTMAPPMFGFGMGDLILLRLEDMAGYRQEMRRILDERAQR
jgi:hypothetical protein